MRLEIDELEWALLVGLLDDVLGDLRDEIYRSERHDFKEQLRAKKEIVKGLIARLRQETAVPAGAA